MRSNRFLLLVVPVGLLVGASWLAESGPSTVWSNAYDVFTMGAEGGVVGTGRPEMNWVSVSALLNAPSIAEEASAGLALVGVDSGSGAMPLTLAAPMRRAATMGPREPDSIGLFGEFDADGDFETQLFEGFGVDWGSDTENLGWLVDGVRSLERSESVEVPANDSRGWGLNPSSSGYRDFGGYGIEMGTGSGGGDYFAEP